MSQTIKLIQAMASRCPNGRLPDDYLVLDIETTGFDFMGRKSDPDVVVQLGYAAVRGRRIVSKGGTFIHPGNKEMHPGAAEATGLTTEFLRENGEPRKEVYERFLPMFDLFKRSGGMFVGHNFHKFDAPFMNADMERCGIDFRFQESDHLDTGMLFKAVKLQTLPAEDETLGRFFKRVGDTRSRVKWKLALAMEEYGLIEEHSIDLEEAHDAGYDCWMTFLLMERLRELGAKQEATSYESEGGF